MAERPKIDQPPPTGDAALDSWLQRFVTEFNRGPQISVESLSDSPADSGYTGDVGDVLINVGSGGSVAYINTSGTTSSWRRLVLE